MRGDPPRLPREGPGEEAAAELSRLRRELAESSAQRQVLAEDLRAMQARHAEERASFESRLASEQKAWLDATRKTLLEMEEAKDELARQRDAALSAVEKAEWWAGREAARAAELSTMLDGVGRERSLLRSELGALRARVEAMQEQQDRARVRASEEPEILSVERVASPPPPPGEALLPPEQPWRFAAASAVGTSHLSSATPCQDAFGCELFADRAGREVLAAVVCDGAGGARLAQLGASSASSAILAGLQRHFASGGRVEDLSRPLFTEHLQAVRGALAALAVKAGLAVRDLACTVALAVVGEGHAVFAQVGDGVIVTSQRGEKDGFSWVFWPERGEYANQTVFVTDEAFEDHLAWRAIEGPVDDVALLTDGLQAQVLDYKKRLAHPPFFREMFKPVRVHPAQGQLAALSTQLEVYLSSPQVNARTDDDKTLVLATRRARG